MVHPSVSPDLRRYWLDVAGARVTLDRPVVEADLPCVVHPGEAVLHPVRVVARRMVLARVRPAALGAVSRGMDRRERLAQQVVELERLDEVGVEHERTVEDLEVAHRGVAALERRAAL